MIGKRLKELRLAMGLTQEQLGKLVGVSKVAICDYEREKKNPEIKNFIKLAEILNVEPKYLLGLEVNINDKSTLTTNDIKIIKEIKKHEKLYLDLCENLEETINSLTKQI